MAELEEGAFDGEEKDGRHRVNAELDADQSRDGRRRDVVSPEKPSHEMDHEFLNEIGAVGDARDERCTRNFDTAKG